MRIAEGIAMVYACARKAFVCVCGVSAIPVGASANELTIAISCQQHGPAKLMEAHTQTPPPAPQNATTANCTPQMLIITITITIIFMFIASMCNAP
jgi:hypothetical protein